MPDDINPINEASCIRRLTREFNDLQNEIAGRDVGRNSRFLSAAAERLRGNGKGGRKGAGLSALDLLMQDAAYKQAYQQTYSALSNTETLVHDALLEFQGKLDEARMALKDAKGVGVSAEELKKLKQVVTDTKNQHDILLGFDTELQNIRDHIQDEDNPPSQAELDMYQERIGEIGIDIQEHHMVHKEMKAEADMAQSIATRSSDMDIPTI